MKVKTDSMVKCSQSNFMAYMTGKKFLNEKEREWKEVFDLAKCHYFF